jgi:hypothetical protein
MKACETVYELFKTEHRESNISACKTLIIMFKVNMLKY